jgi:hypothetical protein
VHTHTHTYIPVPDATKNGNNIYVEKHQPQKLLLESGQKKNIKFTNNPQGQAYPTTMNQSWVLQVQNRRN